MYTVCITGTQENSVDKYSGPLEYLEAVRMYKVARNLQGLHCPRRR